MEHNKQIFIAKWGADPEEIWLRGKTFEKRNLVYPIDSDVFSESMKRAMIHLEDKDFIEAQNDLDRAVNSYDNSQRKGFEQINLDEVLNLAGNTALMNGDLENAQTYFEKELQINPTSSRACIGLAEVFFNAELYEESKTMFEWSLKYDQTNSAAVEGLRKVNGILELEEEHNSLESKN